MWRTSSPASAFAVGYDRERFVDLAKRSPRLRPLIEMVTHGRQAALEPQRRRRQCLGVRRRLWTQRRRLGLRAAPRRRPRCLPRRLHEGSSAPAPSTASRTILRLDAIELHGILEEIGLEGGKVPTIIAS